MNVFDVYPLYDVAPVKAEDVFITDSNGHKYLDFYDKEEYPEFRIWVL